MWDLISNLIDLYVADGHNDHGNPSKILTLNEKPT